VRTTTVGPGTAAGRSLRATAGRLARRAVQAWHKFRWGVRVVGFWPAAAGALRLAWLRLDRSERAEVRLRSGATIGFDVPSQVPPALVMFRTLIDPEFPLLTEIAEPDWVVLDVGAAIGQFSVFAGRLPVAVVHAYEPSSSNIASLQRNIAANGLTDRTRIHQVALSDSEGEQQFATQGNAYLSRLDTGSTSPLESERVPVRTLAGECERLGLDRISVLKVNVAGYEPEVLAGAVPLLASGSVEILVMLIGERSIPWYRRCADWGYRFFFYDPSGRVLHELADLDLDTLEHPPWPARHVIAVHRDALTPDRFGAVRLALREPTAHDPHETSHVVAR
jgi:FkbM family methyltransferase